MIAISDKIRVLSIKADEFRISDIPPEHKKILKKYARIFIKELKEGKFPSSDTEILMRYSEKVLRSL